MYKRKRNKYNSQKIVTKDGIFDSKREYNRYLQLKEKEETGLISNLQRQVPFELIPSQKDNTGKVIERPLKYIADFVYADENNHLTVEDAKGFRTDAYIIKRKIMLEKFDIRIKEV